MGLYFRKSIKLNKYLRINFSKTGVGMTATIPGTGLRYSTPKIGGLKIEREGRSTRNAASAGRTATSNMPYTQTVTNEYTGEARDLRASSEWELQRMVENETARQTQNELRQRRIDNIESQAEAVNEMNSQLSETKNAILNILEDTLNVDDRLDWSTQMMDAEYGEFSFDEQPPKKEDDNKLSFFKKKSSLDTSYELKLQEYNERRDRAYRQYLYEKEEYERRARHLNAEIVYLRENFEYSEPSAVEKYISIILSNSRYPDEINIDFDTQYKKSSRTLYIDCLMPSPESLPMIRSYRFNQATNRIEEVPMTASECADFYERTVYNIAIRTIHEMFEAIYTDGVNDIVFNAYALNDGLEEETIPDDFEQVTHCIMTIETSRENFTAIDLRNNSLNRIISSLTVKRITDFLSNDEEISPIR